MWSFLRRISLTWWIIIATVLGVVVGYLDNRVWTATDLAPILQPFSTIFLRMIKAIVAPLIFGALVVGIAGHGDDLKRVGRLALRSLIYFELVTTVALFIGLGAANLIRPGEGVALGGSVQAGAQLVATKPTFASVLEHAVPQSFFEAAAKNEVLQIVFFAILFGVGLAQTRGKVRETMLAFCDSLTEVMFKFTNLVMMYAPIGIGAAVAVVVGKSGLGVLKNLGALVLTLYGSLAVFVLVVLLPVAWLARVPIRRFWRWVKEPWLIAFTTASSEAALPLALENMEKFGVPRRIVSFVLPTGYSFNLDGS